MFRTMNTVIVIIPYPHVKDNQSQLVNDDLMVTLLHLEKDNVNYRWIAKT